MPKDKTKDAKEERVEMKYVYLCPSCSGEAIETSNKMLGVKVDCKDCNLLIEVNDPERYKKLKK